MEETTAYTSVSCSRCGRAFALAGQIKLPSGERFTALVVERDQASIEQTIAGACCYRCANKMQERDNWRPVPLSNALRRLGCRDLPVLWLPPWELPNLRHQLIEQNGKQRRRRESKKVDPRKYTVNRAVTQVIVNFASAEKTEAGFFRQERQQQTRLLEVTKIVRDSVIYPLDEPRLHKSQRQREENKTGLCVSVKFFEQAVEDATQRSKQSLEYFVRCQRIHRKIAKQGIGRKSRLDEQLRAAAESAFKQHLACQGAGLILTYYLVQAQAKLEQAQGASKSKTHVVFRDSGRMKPRRSEPEPPQPERF